MKNLKSTASQKKHSFKQAQSVFEIQEPTLTKGLYTEQEAAFYLGISVITLANMRKSGIVKPTYGGTSSDGMKFNPYYSANWIRKHFGGNSDDAEAPTVQA